MISAFLFFVFLNSPSHASPSRPAIVNGIDGSTALSNIPPAASLDNTPNITPLRSCDLDGRPPNLSDCVFIVDSHIRDSDFQNTYRYGQGGNYSGPYTWIHNECEFGLVVRIGEGFESTLHWIFGVALLVGTNCAGHDPPRGGSAILNPLREGWAVIYVRRPQESSLPSTIDASSALNGTANISGPAIQSRSCVPYDPGPNFDDCSTLFMDETSKPHSTTIQTFGAQGTYTGPFSWVHGACEFQLGMSNVPILSTTLAWIFQTAVRLMLECSKLTPPEGGIAFLDRPHRGVFIKAFRPLAPVSQQKRSLRHPEPLPHTLTHPTPETIPKPSSACRPCPPLTSKTASYCAQPTSTAPSSPPP